MCDHGRGLDGRTVARGRRTAGTGGKRLAAGRNRQLGGGGGGVAFEARGYKRGWADERAGRRASRRPKSSQNRANRA